MIRIIAVDDEHLMLERMRRCVREAEPDAQLILFSSSKEALEYAGAHTVDVCFLDISMPVLDGVTLAKRIKLIQPRVNIIFTTGYSEYMPDAFLLNASGYLLKPVTTKMVREQLDILRFPVQTKSSEKLRIRCFGNFEVFCGSRPVRFRHGKTKELLAYITSRRGATCTNREIMATIWEEDSHASYFRDLRKDLVDTLGAVGYADVIEIGRGKMALIAENVECDYFQWLDGMVSGINAYRGEFMSQYSWAEFINAALWRNGLEK